MFHVWSADAWHMRQRNPSIAFRVRVSCHATQGSACSVRSYPSLKYSDLDRCVGLELTPENRPWHERAWRLLRHQLHNIGAQGDRYFEIPLELGMALQLLP